LTFRNSHDPRSGPTFPDRICESAKKSPIAKQACHEHTAVRFGAAITILYVISHNVEESAPCPKVHLLSAISSARATRMGILSWKRCRRRRKTRKVCSTCLPPRHQRNTYRWPLALSFWRPSTPSQREHMKRHSLSPRPPTPQRRSPGLHSPPPTKRPRRGVEPISGSVPAPVQAGSRYRRSHSGEPPALNAEFEIDPAANAGVPFAFNEVVRGRPHRHRLHAGECEECRGVSGAYSPLLLNTRILIFASRR
jgi:hypothetical protein